MRRTETDNLSKVLALEERVIRARGVLQRTTDRHPDFERRVRNLVQLAEELNRAQWRGVGASGIQ